jgi:hypothetical protein
MKRFQAGRGALTRSLNLCCRLFFTEAGWSLRALENPGFSLPSQFHRDNHSETLFDVKQFSYVTGRLRERVHCPSDIHQSLFNLIFCP